VTLEWSTSCKDWERRIVAGESLIPFAPLFPEQAEAAMRIYRELVIVDQPAIEAADGSTVRPTFGTLSRPWILEFVSHIFGSYDADTGRRLITEFFLSISKKNAKSTAGAGIMLTALILNWRQSGEFSIISPTIEIANNSFFPARDMIRADDELRDLLLVQEHYRTITHRVSNATLKVVAADNEAVGGKKSIGTLIDELWIFGKRPNAENMLREATGGQASRPEGFTVYLTTQSDEPPAGVFKQKLSYARGVRDGRIQDKRFLPLLYEFPEAMIKDESYLDRKNFHITNPNLGASVDPEFLDRRLAEAQESGEESIRGFLAKHLNIEIGLGLQSDNWAGALFWEENSERALTLEEIIRRCEVVSVGIDGGGLDDMLGLSAIGREKGTGLWLHWAHAWIHPIVLDRRKKEAARFRDFEADGDLTIVDKIGDDLTQVAARIQQIEDAGVLERVGVDVAGIGGVVDALVSPKPKGIGLAQDRIVGIPQGWKMVGAIKTLERKLAENMVKHAGSNLMAWVIGNAKVEPRGNAIVITKQLAGSAKIDPLMATFNAVTLMALNPEPRQKQYQVMWV
jgi:phage terminase large subunit-like protein